MYCAAYNMLGVAHKYIVNSQAQYEIHELVEAMYGDIIHVHALYIDTELLTHTNTHIMTNCTCAQCNNNCVFTVVYGICVCHMQHIRSVLNYMHTNLNQN
jgi:hypothetical protein